MAEVHAAPLDSSSLPAAPQLFKLEPIDVADVWQQELVDSFQVVSQLTSGKSSGEAHDALQQRASENMKSHNELVSGLIYGVLTETPGDIYFRQLSLIARDGYAHAISRLQLLASSQKFSQLRHKVRVQLVWVVSALVRGNAAGSESLALLLTRQMRGGDVSQPNLWLVQQVLTLLESNYEWLIAHPQVVATAAYAFGRLTLDLGGTRTELLRAQCGALVVRLIRERFADCAMVGRDLVRMLQDAAKLPQFRDLWADLMHRPHVISPLLAQGGIEQLLRVPTPRVFLANRITFAMEARLLFILEHVPVTGYTRNLMWFVHRYLSAPEAETLYADIIRYICGVFHPSNSVLASNIVPRYVFLGSLLRFIRSQVVAANAKLALFYDWLFYDPQADNIMNVEPGVLIMARSVDRYPFLTASFIEFLVFVSEAYAPSLAPAIRRSVGLVMRDAIDKGVIPSLIPIYEQPRLGRPAKRHMQVLFPLLVPQDPPQSMSGEAGNGRDNDDDDECIHSSEPLLSHPSPGNNMEEEEREEDTLPLPPVAKAVVVDTLDPVSLDPVSRMFHDDYDSDSDTSIDDDDESPANVTPPPLVEDTSDSPLFPTSSSSNDSLLSDPSLSMFGGDSARLLSDFIESKSPQTVAEIIRVFSQSSSSSPSSASVIAVARILASVALLEGEDGGDVVELEDVETNAELTRMGETSSVEHDLLHAIMSSIIVIIMATDDGCRNSSPLCLDLLVQLTRARVDVGFRWLLHCIDAGMPQLYAQYVGRFASGTVALALARDLGVLQERFTALFYDSLPTVYAAFPSDLPGSPAIVRKVLSLIDQPQVYRLTVLINRGLLRLFGKSMMAAGLTTVVVVADTMECDAFEQVCLWQLLAAEISGDERAIGRVVRRVLLLGNFDPSSNSEAATGILALLRTVPPTPRILRILVRYYEEGKEEEDETLGEKKNSSRADMCGCILTAWMQSGDHHSALRRVLAVGGSAYSALVDAWTERFGLQRFNSLTIGELLSQPPPPPPPPPPPIVADNDMEFGSVADMFTPTEEQSATTSIISGTKRRNSTPPALSPPRPLPVVTVPQRRQRLAKRRRRNVITSDDDDDDDDNEQDNNNNNEEVLLSSSPVLSSSSLESDNSD